MIDCHHHLWELDAVHYPWLMAKGHVRFFGDPTPIQRNYLVDEFRDVARSQGVHASIHIQVGAEDPLAEALWVQQVAEMNPGWPAAQVVHVDLTHPELDANLDAMQELETVRGVRQIVGRSAREDALSGTNSLLDDPDFNVGLSRISARSLSFDLQLTPNLMRRAADVFSGHPRLRVALCHAGSPDVRDGRSHDTWREGILDLAKLDGVFCKLSGLAMFARDAQTAVFRPFIEHCLDAFGPDRCMFGSNFPVDSLHADYASNLLAYWTSVPSAWQERVFENNAKSFYRL